MGGLGRLGNGGTSNVLVPTKLEEIDDKSAVVQIACGCYHNLILLGIYLLL